MQMFLSPGRETKNLFGVALTYSYIPSKFFVDYASDENVALKF